MLVLDDISGYCPTRGLCLTIGNFDGLHLGHQALIDRTRQSAAEKNLDFAVMTFWPHPRTVLAPQKPHFPLMDREERLRLLQAMKLPLLFELPFDNALASQSARDFVEKSLMPLGLSHLVIGHDFSMGRGREGTAEALRKLGAELSFSLERISPVTVDGVPVSSSRLREAIARGDVEMARAMLGRNYSIQGKIEHGDARGRELGFPTANLGEIHSLLPGHGIYACLAHVKGKILPAAVSIGTNPTFNGQKTTVESFLLEDGEDLYGEDMRLEFVARLRDQRKFASAAELTRQIGQDVAKAREILAVYGKKA